MRRRGLEFFVNPRLKREFTHLEMTKHSSCVLLSTPTVLNKQAHNQSNLDSFKKNSLDTNYPQIIAQTATDKGFDGSLIQFASCFLYRHIETNVRNQLTEAHYKHLCSEGFGDHIDLLMTHGIKSITKQEAGLLGFWAGVDNKSQTSSGLLFPFTKEFAQLRADDKGFPKYFGKSKTPSAAYLPIGCQVVTEGLKDAFACSIFGGIPTGAIAGVSCFASCLEQGSELTILFDSDGWQNPMVFEQLIKGGLHTGGKIQLIPQIEGQPKAGAVEYFKAGYDADDFAALIASAMTIEKFMFELPKHWAGLDEVKLHECVHKLVRLACEHLKPHKLEALLLVIKKAGVPLGATRSTVKEVRQEQESRKASEREKERRERAAQSNTVLIGMKDDGEGGFIPPGQGAVATAIATALKDRLAYDPTSTKFYKYESEILGVWSPEILEASHQRIAQILDENGASGNYGQNYVAGVHSLTRGALIAKEEEWGSDRRLIPFRNGVLDTEKRKLLPHDPTFRLRWGLPFDYDQIATCEPIQEWLLEVNSGHADRVQLCRAWLKAVLTGQSRFQKFLYLVGSGGTGKTTWLNLVEACLGQSNVVVSDLVSLETNNFETANLRNKRLLCIHEVHKFANDITVLKNATGQSPLRYELKGIQQGASFIFQGMVMMSGNEEMRSNESTSALFRRKISLPFSVVCSDDQKRDLIGKDEKGNPTGEFAPYLAGLINWALEMPDSDMTAFISQTSRMVPTLQTHASESLVDTNPISSWLDESCFVMADSKTYIGTIDKDKSEYLYSSYNDFCLQRGNKPTNHNRFSSLLIDLLNHQLKVDAAKGRDNRGSYIRGIGIKMPGMNEPRMVTEPSKVTASDGSVMAPVTAQNLMGVEGDGCDGSFTIPHESEKKEKDEDHNESDSDRIFSFSRYVEEVKDSRHSRHSLHQRGIEPSLEPSPEPSLAVTEAIVDWLSDQNIDAMVEMARDCVSDGTPELIESVFDPVPTDIKDQVRQRVLDVARPQSQIKLTV